MRITVLMGSPRKGGNTDLLAQAFAEGANQRHHVEIIHVTELNIHPCLGCNACFRNQNHECCQQDDMISLYDKLAKSDMLVIASPVYFYGISAQLKTVIDRLHNPVRDQFNIRQMSLIAVGAATLPELFDAVLAEYRLCLNFFNLTDKGVILARGCKEKGEVLKGSVMEEARLLGASIGE